MSEEKLLPQIRRHSYFPKNRPRVWWWKIAASDGGIIADGFSSKAEAQAFLRRDER